MSGKTGTYIYTLALFCRSSRDDFAGGHRKCVAAFSSVVYSSIPFPRGDLCSAVRTLVRTHMFFRRSLDHVARSDSKSVSTVVPVVNASIFYSRFDSQCGHAYAHFWSLVPNATTAPAATVNWCPQWRRLSMRPFFMVEPTFAWQCGHW